MTEPRDDDAPPRTSTDEVSGPHVPVLKDELLNLLDLEEGATAVDCTAGAGGHLQALVDKVGPTGRVIALDRDERAFADDAAGGVAKRHPDVVSLLRRPFSSIEEALKEVGVAGGVDAVMADIGVSSMQLDEVDRGFSFRNDAPLDMRMDGRQGMTAAELIRVTPEKELADLIFQYGDERRSRQVAKALKRAQPTTTGEAAEIISRAVGGRRGKIHPATRTFQALRIAVNAELDELDALIDALPRVLKVGGRAAIIAFHSLEDRRVKHGFLEKSRRDEAGRPPVFKLLTKKPVVPGDDEVASNPRSRSAKLRGVEKLPEEDR
jgi:16S rRNA (cytosine1402-N4)-methyltransferase